MDKIIAHEIRGENGIYCKKGTKSYAVKARNLFTHSEEEFIIEGVAGYCDAKTFAQFRFSGMCDILSCKEV